VALPVAGGFQGALQPDWPGWTGLAEMPVVSARCLKILAALVWYGGAAALLLKGRSLLIEARLLRPELGWHWLAIAAGLILGGLQAGLLFNRSCRKNLDRIASLEQPRIWQFFRPGFFVALGVMIAVGATLSRLAHNNYPFLIGVAALDLNIATALLGSSYVFWTHKASME
jgi:hypothetical protein